MKDVAAQAGVGLKTVSRVVNGEPGVTPDTAERVRAAIEALGFRRNDSARVLRKGQTASIGLVLEDVGNPFYSTLARAVEDVTHGNGSLLFMGSSDEDPERERKLTLTFCARRVDGLIIVPASTDHTYLLPEIAAGIAVVFVDRPPGLIDADVVLTDNVGGARDGIRHLIGQGHTRIGYIGDAPHIYTAGQRLRGYQEAMAAAELPIEEHWVAMALAQPEVIQRALGRMLDGPRPGDGGTLRQQPDQRHRAPRARGARRACRDRGLRRFRACRPAEPRASQWWRRTRANGPHRGGTAVPPAFWRTRTRPANRAAHPPGDPRVRGDPATLTAQNAAIIVTGRTRSLSRFNVDSGNLGWGTVSRSAPRRRGAGAARVRPDVLCANTQAWQEAGRDRRWARRAGASSA